MAGFVAGAAVAFVNAGGAAFGRSRWEGYVDDVACKAAVTGSMKGGPFPCLGCHDLVI
jgi:hypothetical protein